jgi:hypothetical protein
MKKPELDLLEVNSIQGLYPVKGCCQSFWTLKARIELAVFREQKMKGESTQ